MMMKISNFSSIIFLRLYSFCPVFVFVFTFSSSLCYICCFLCGTCTLWENFSNFEKDLPGPGQMVIVKHKEGGSRERSKSKFLMISVELLKGIFHRCWNEWNEILLFAACDEEGEKRRLHSRAKWKIIIVVESSREEVKSLRNCVEVRSCWG